MFQKPLNGIAVTAEQPSAGLAVVTVIRLGLSFGRELTFAYRAFVLLLHQKLSDHFRSEAGSALTLERNSIAQIGWVSGGAGIVLGAFTGLDLWLPCMRPALGGNLWSRITQPTSLLNLRARVVLAALLIQSRSIFRCFSLFANVSKVCRPLLRSVVRLPVLSSFHLRSVRHIRAYS